ncbi:MAG: hypothetical protein SFV15_24995 [Polyangiaceae bacterium]|nr:hypothetical protein [Polyangiaceae bacterium]
MRHLSVAKQPSTRRYCPSFFGRSGRGLWVLCAAVSGLSLSVGCGGRSGMEDLEGFEPIGGSGGFGGSGGSGGVRVGGSGGQPVTGGVGGGVPAGGGGGFPAGGFGGVPAGGFGGGGFPAGGFGGVPAGGFGGGGFPAGGFGGVPAGGFGGFTGGAPAGGFGGFITGGAPAGGAGGGTNPIDCLSCAVNQCPAASVCFQNPTCLNGTVCALNGCFNNQGFDFGCVLGCFGGDVNAATQAFSAFACITQSCPSACVGQ